MLNNISFADRIVFEAYGLTIGIDVTDAAAIERIKNILPFYSKVAGSDAPADHNFQLVWGKDESEEDALYQEGKLIAQRVDTERLIALLDTFLRMTIGENSPGYLFVHAGVIRWKDEAIIFPAKSYSGKTSIVAELIKHGAVYYSDEYAVIDAEGFVHPYPKPLSIRKEGEFIQLDTPVEELGGQQGEGRIPARLIILTEYEAGAEWKPEVLTPAQGVMALIPHTLAIKINPKFTLQVLNLISNRAIIASTKRSDVLQVADLILNFPNR